MRINSFEEIISWQRARALTICVYNDFRNCRDYGFKDQIQRASVSIMNNIAEGFDRNSNKEFRNFLCIARGSCSEVKSMLYIAPDLGYINKEQYENLNEKIIEISKLLNGFIKTL